MTMPNFTELVGLATRRVSDDLALRSPVLAQKVAAWLETHAGAGDAQKYFLYPESLPVLALPWWLESLINGTPDPVFQADLMYSSVSGYYFTRLLDDMMDGARVDAAVMPALAVFQMQFQQPYVNYFPASDRFWQTFVSEWTLSAEITCIDAAFTTLTEADFKRVSGKKATAAFIPIAAVCFRYQRPDLLARWTEFFTLLVRWHQMRDDFRDWSKDEQSGIQTWLLCEAERRRVATESTASWLGREGFQWVKDVMDAWMAELVTAAEQLDSPPALAYVHRWRVLFDAQIDTVLLSLASISSLFGVNK
jgi:hypothetical protein